MGWSSGCSSLYNFILSVVVRGSVCVVWDIDCLFFPVDNRVCFFQPGDAKDNILISTINHVEESSVDYSIDLNE